MPPLRKPAPVGVRVGGGDDVNDLLGLGDVAISGAEAGGGGVDKAAPGVTLGAAATVRGGAGDRSPTWHQRVRDRDKEGSRGGGIGGRRMGMAMFPFFCV